MNLTSGQLARIGALSDQWSFLWDKRRSLWIAAEDCPEGEQIEEADLNALLARLPAVSEAVFSRRQPDPGVRGARRSIP
jgi:hypothetical protein